LLAENSIFETETPESRTGLPLQVRMQPILEPLFKTRIAG
jgi:hypothetical protein